jgi:hypothetical protein
MAVHIELWKGVCGWLGKYSVSTFGRVRNDKTMYILTPMRTGTKRKGSQRSKVRFSTNPRMDYDVAHLVLETFVCLRPIGHVAMHKDDDSANNALSNIHWGTHKDNALDCVAKGRHGCQKVKHHRYGEIRAAKEFGLTYVEVGNMYGISPQRVCDIVKGRCHDTK